jgi:protein-S-isoprenylcysteine O-methyltransferase Ste14
MSFKQFFQLVAAALFFAFFFGKTVFIARRGVNPFAFIGSESRSRVLVETLLLVAFAGFFVEVFNYAFGEWVRLLPEFMHNPLFEGALTGLVGIFFIVVGFAVLTISYIDLGVSWRIGMDDDQPFSLVTTGIYRWTRNPIHVALDLYVWGTFLMIPTPVFLILALMVTAAAHAVTLSEESYLLERFGAAFENYLKHTNRYLPFRRSSVSVATSVRPALPTPTPPRHRPRGRGIKATIGNILTRPQEGRTAGQVIVWWEQRRGTTISPYPSAA